MRDAEEIKKQINELVSEYYESKFKNEQFIPGVTPVHNSGKSFGVEELNTGIEAVLDGWWTEGRFTKSFETKLTKYVGVKHAIFTNSGSSANLLAMYSITDEEHGEKRLKKRDEVITVAAAFPTTISPIVQIGAVPVFVDIEPLETGMYNIDCSLLEKSVSERTKAIFLAHTLGNPFNLNEILKIKDKYGLWLIEDCCDALGSRYNGKNVGTFGDIATLSFYPAHHITTGEGGAVLTNNVKIKRIAESFRNWGRDCWCEPGKDNTCGRRFEWQLGNLPFGYDHKNIYTRLGFNLKNTDLQASIGIVQLDRMNHFTRKRQENFNYLYENLKEYEDKIILPEHLPNTEPNWFGFLISTRNNSNFTRNELVNYLTARKIMTRPLFAGNIIRHPCFDSVEYKVSGSLENTNATMDRTFWVGIQPNINEQKREYIAKIIKDFLQK